jgi:hypothetical protein
VRDQFDEWVSGALPVAIACAVVLLFATVARQFDGSVNDDPTGYRFLTLSGLVAAVVIGRHCPEQRGLCSQSPRLL